MPKFVCLLAALLLFLALAGFWLDRPGLHYDEALEGGLPAVQVLHGQPLTVVNHAVLHVGGRELPLMVQSHIGAMQVYAALPFIMVGGPTTAALRSMTVLVGLVTIVALFFFLDWVFGALAACYGSLWLATFPTFVFWSRQGVFVTSLAACCAMLALAALAHWLRTRRAWVFGVAGLCAGLAVYNKLNAFWLLNGTIGWGALVWVLDVVHRRRGALPRLDRATLVLGGGGFVVALLPLLFYNVLTSGATFGVIGSNAAQTYLGVSNADIVGNLRTRLAQVFDVVRSGDHLWYLGGTFANHWAPPALGAALLALVLGALLFERAQWRRTLFVPFLCAAVIAQSCFTISGLWQTHFAVAITLPALLFGMGVAQVRRWCDVRSPVAARAGAWLVGFLVALVLVAQVESSLRYLRAVTATGGLSFHSSAIADLERFLATRSERLVALDWGIAAPVEYLSGARLHVEEFFSYEPEPPPDFAARLQERFGSNELYITHAPHEEAFPRREAFLQAVAAAGLVAEPLNVSVRADGWALLEVWRVSKR